MHVKEGGERLEEEEEEEEEEETGGDQISCLHTQERWRKESAEKEVALAKSKRHTTRTDTNI